MVEPVLLNHDYTIREASRSRINMSEHQFIVKYVLLLCFESVAERIGEGNDLGIGTK